MWVAAVRRTDRLYGWHPGQPVRTVRDLEDEPGGRIVIRMSRMVTHNAQVIIIPTLTQRINQVQLPYLCDHVE